MTTTLEHPYTRIPMPDVGTPEWHKLRRNGVGASECAAVMGLSKWASPLDVYLYKRELEETTSTRAMRRGNAMEPFILSEFELETGYEGSKPTYMCVSVKHPHLFCNLDWLETSEEFGVEAKSSDDTRAWGEHGSQDVPLDYYMQVQHQLLVTGLPLIYLVVLLPFADLRTYPITPDLAIFDRIIERTYKFWVDTQHGCPPEGDASTDAVKKLFSEVDAGKEIELDEESVMPLIERHRKISQSITALEQQEEAVKAQLLMQLGDAKKAKIPGWNGSLTRSERAETVVPSFKRKAGITFRINHPRS